MKNTSRELLAAQDMAQERQRLLASGAVRLLPEQPASPPRQDEPAAPTPDQIELPLNR